MKVSLNKMMENLGIDHVLTAFESDMHQTYDAATSATCSAEVRMGPPDAHELEVEVQIFRDNPQEGELPFEQIMYLVIKPKMGQEWEPVLLKVRNEDMTGGFGDWEGGACDFYRAVTYHLKMDEFPDIDDLIDEHLDGEKGHAGRAGRRGGGRKNPKFKPPQNQPKNPNFKTGM